MLIQSSLHRTFIFLSIDNNLCFLSFINLCFANCAFDILAAFAFCVNKAQNWVCDQRSEDQSGRQPLYQAQIVAKVQHREHDVEELSDGQHKATWHNTEVRDHLAREKLPATANEQYEADIDQDLRMQFAELQKLSELAARRDAKNEEQRAPRVHEEHEV